MRAFLVIDVGTTGLRAAIVDEQLHIVDLEHRANAPTSPAQGMVEFDANEMAALTLGAARTVLERFDGRVEAVGITNQRASTVLWDRVTGHALAPGLGWQDLRTVFDCIMAKAEHGWALGPNQTATKAAWLLANTPDLDGRDLCIGTIDSWIAFTLSGGESHVSDTTNSSTTMGGLRLADGSGWNLEMCDAFGIPESVLPTVVESVGTCAVASTLPGAPPITAIIGDQQASLVGQACVRPGQAKITFGTGGILDLCTDIGPPESVQRNDAGTYPLPLWSHNGRVTWGVEGIMLSAGSNVEWLQHDLGMIDNPAHSHDVASGCDSSEGVVYVPALLGLGTPVWDYGARGALLGLTRGSTRHHVVRAVLEGVAQRGVDLIEAASTDTGTSVDAVRLDGGMSRNPTFVQACADALGRPIEVAPVAESTTIGAAFLAGLGVGVWSDVADIEELWEPTTTVEPRPDVDSAAARSRWLDARGRAGGWYPDLSALDF